MHMKKLFYFLPVVLLTACSSANIDLQNQRLESLEEKVDALLDYNNKTYDILVDNELRISEMEKDAKTRGVPVPQKIVSVDSIKPHNYVVANAGTPHAAINPENLPVQEVKPVGEVGALTGQDLTKVDEKTQKQVKENVVQPPKQEVKSESKQTAEETKKAADQTAKHSAAPKQEAQAKAGQTEQASAPVKEAAAAQAEPKDAAQQTAQAPEQKPTVKAEQASDASKQQVSTIATSSKQLYDNAYNLYQRKQFAQSEMAFDAFLEQYPQDVLAPNALYWKGETLYARALYPQAIFAFKEVQTRYPKHPKTADSLLKTAMSYARLGDNENASLHYLVLLEDWPQSAAAQKARAMGAQ